MKSIISLIIKTFITQRSIGLSIDFQESELDGAIYRLNLGRFIIARDAVSCW